MKLINVLWCFGKHGLGPYNGNDTSFRPKNKLTNDHTFNIMMLKIMAGCIGSRNLLTDPFLFGDCDTDGNLAILYTRLSPPTVSHA